MSYFSFLDSKNIANYSIKSIQNKLDNLKCVNQINQYELILKNLETIRGSLDSEKESLKLIGDELLKMVQLLTSVLDYGEQEYEQSIHNIRFQLEKYNENINSIVDSSYYMNIKTLRSDMDYLVTYNNVNNSSDPNKNKIQIIYYRADTNNLGGKKNTLNNPSGIIENKGVPIEITNIDYETGRIYVEPNQKNIYIDFNFEKLLLVGDYISIGNSNNQYKVKKIDKNVIEVHMEMRNIPEITFKFEKNVSLNNKYLIRYSYVGEVDWSKNSSDYKKELDIDNWISRDNIKDHLDTLQNAIQQIGNYIRDIETNSIIVKTRIHIFNNLKQQLIDKVNK